MRFLRKFTVSWEYFNVFVYISLWVLLKNKAAFTIFHLITFPARMKDQKKSWVAKRMFVERVKTTIIRYRDHNEAKNDCILPGNPIVFWICKLYLVLCQTSTNEVMKTSKWSERPRLGLSGRLLDTQPELGKQKLSSMERSFGNQHWYSQLFLSERTFIRTTTWLKIKKVTDSIDQASIRVVAPVRSHDNKKSQDLCIDYNDSLYVKSVISQFKLFYMQKSSAGVMSKTLKIVLDFQIRINLKLFLINFIDYHQIM